MLGQGEQREGEVNRGASEGMPPKSPNHRDPALATGHSQPPNAKSTAPHLSPALTRTLSPHNATFSLDERLDNVDAEDGGGPGLRVGKGRPNQLYQNYI